MTNKIKIKDLEDDPLFPDAKEELNPRLAHKVNVDELPEGEYSESLKDSFKEKLKETQQQSVDIKVAPQKIVESLVYFKRSFVISYLSKFLSFSLVLLSLDLISYFLKYLDGVNVSDFSNYRSVYLSHDMSWNICKAIGFIISIYFLTNKRDIIVNKKGLFCVNSEMMYSILLNPKNVFIPWEAMSKVKVKIRFFEVYLYFYDSHDKKIGHLEFSLESKNKFFNFVESKTSKNHPLVLIKSKLFLF